MSQSIASIALVVKDYDEALCSRRRPRRRGRRLEQKIELKKNDEQ
jgi:hypothetical protein